MIKTNACTVCRTAVDLVRHDFFEGTKERPVRVWSYWAALYHHPTTHVSYCSARCATTALRAAP